MAPLDLELLQTNGLIQIKLALVSDTRTLAQAPGIVAQLADVEEFFHFWVDFSPVSHPVKRQKSA